jgi:hypothetical protein
MAQFEDAKVGDRVWSLRYGWGEVSEENVSDVVTTMFNGEEKCWFTNGKRLSSDLNPTLFWDEVKIISPERPKEHECKYEKVNAEHCICGNFKLISYQRPKEECEACEFLNENRDWSDLLTFLLNQHHTCEKKVKWACETGHHFSMWEEKWKCHRCGYEENDA